MNKKHFLSMRKWLKRFLSIFFLLVAAWTIYEFVELARHDQAERKKTAHCEQLEQAMETVLSYGKRTGAIEMREALIASGQASPERVQEIFSTHDRDIQAAGHREFKDGLYWMMYWGWRFSRALTRHAFDC